MEQIELVKTLLKNSYINFLLGAGTSYNKVDGKMNFPLMGDLLNFVKKDVKVLEFYNNLKKRYKYSSRIGRYDCWFV